MTHDPITVLTPTGTLGYGFGTEALARGMSLGPAAIAVDAGSTDPGPYYLGSRKPLASDLEVGRELAQLIAAARAKGIPLIVGSVGGAGTAHHVDRTVELVRQIARDQNLHFRLARIYSDIPLDRAAAAVAAGEIVDFEAGTPLTAEDVAGTVSLVAQMGHEPICAALDAGADVIIAGRACDDSVIAAYPIWKGADPGLAIHMGKILECGALCAEPFAMDVMMGTILPDRFVLEPGSAGRRASVRSVAAHSLYERENPFVQFGPGHRIDLTDCSFEQQGDRQVVVRGARIEETGDYYVKLEGAGIIGYRSICIAGLRCPSLGDAIDAMLADVRERAERAYGGPGVTITFHQYGRDAVMKALEPDNGPDSGRGHETGLLIDVLAPDQDRAHSICHFISGALLHYHFDGIVNPSGNLAFPYSPSDLDLGPQYGFCAYHLMKVASPTELFPVHLEDL